MSGLPDWNRDAFELAEARLSYDGHTVLSPANNIPMVNPEAISHSEYLSICFAMIDICDGVYFLKGWETSKGANMEMKYALGRGKRIFFEGGEMGVGW